MDFKFVKDFMESIFHEEMWVFEIVFCMIVHTFLFMRIQEVNGMIETVEDRL